MTSKVHYLADILEKIGAPLVRAAARGDQSNEPQNIALLLSRSVQLSIEIGKIIDIDKAGADGVEALRVTLAALASPIVAQSFQSTGSVPSEAELNKIVTALESVMTFSDNFMPSDEQAARMGSLQAEGAAVDGYQSNIQYIQALSPVVDAVASFSFGQQEKKMVLDVCSRLVNEAKTVRKDSFPKAEGDDAKRIELGLLRGFGDIYAICHKQSVAKLSALKDPGPDAQSKAASDVWENFQKRAAMIGVLAQNLSPEGVKTEPAPQATSPSPLKPPPVTSPAAQASVAAPQTTAPQSAAPMAQPPAQPAQDQAQQGGFNPMSMFGNAPASDTPQAAPPSTPPTQPVQQDAPAQQPATPSIFSQNDVTGQNAGQAQGEEDGSGEGTGDGGGPMSFFKKGG